MKIAVEDFAARLADAAGQQVEPDAVEALHVIAPADHVWPLVGWPPHVANEAIYRLMDLFAALELPQSQDQPPSAFAESGPWIYVFAVGQLRARAATNGAEMVELWRSMRLPLLQRYQQTGTPEPQLAYRLNAEAERHIGPGDWHLHPVKDGRHLGYRLFFDAARTQQDLSWEVHGRGGPAPKGGLWPWGDPSIDVLDAAHSQQLHSACLAAVRAKTALAPKGRPFREWARMFGVPVGSAHVAHPPVSSPKHW